MNFLLKSLVILAFCGNALSASLGLYVPDAGAADRSVGNPAGARQARQIGVTSLLSNLLGGTGGGPSGTSGTLTSLLAGAQGPVTGLISGLEGLAGLGGLGNLGGSSGFGGIGSFLQAPLSNALSGLTGGILNRISPYDPYISGFNPQFAYQNYPAGNLLNYPAMYFN